jgi:nucleotidyltransferase/DNA polymerase involved in DNA repair
MTPSELTQQIRNEIFESTQLTASAGNLNTIKVLILGSNHHLAAVK